MSIPKNITLSVALGLLIVSGSVYLSISNSSDPQTSNITETQNVEVRDGIQYVTIVARGGYSPRQTTIQPDLPTKLIVKTDGTFDCSAALVVRSANFKKILKPSGEEVIDLGTPKTGDKIQGTCSMGMYNFQIKTS